MLILNIDTAIDKGSFCVCENNKVAICAVSENRNDLAGWLHIAINDALTKNGIEINDLDAVAVSNGPGSYTGLRIGLATAKGLCYALKKPLIIINTLQLIAASVQSEAVDLICPMIDARRMEVFTAIYDKSLNVYKAPFAKELSKDSFSDILQTRQILFLGNGSRKFQAIFTGINGTFIDKNIDALDMIPLSINAFNKKNFANVAYCEPYYVKDVYIANN